MVTIQDSDLLNEYFEYIKNNVPNLPPVIDDIERFSGLHSWYKHLGEFQIAYPLLLKGEEARYDFDTQYSDQNQSNFHWRFILSEFAENYGITINNQYYDHIPQPILQHMKKYPIYFNNDLGCTHNASHQFQMKISEKVCEQFYKDICGESESESES